MKLIPFEKIALETKLTEMEITDRFSGFIEPEDIFRIKMITSDEPEIPYEGTINNHQFKIQRITNNLRAATPVVSGIMENNFGKIIIHIKIRPRISQIAGLFIFSLFVIYKIVALSSSFDLFTLFFLGMIIYAYFFMMSTFKNESLRAKIDLIKLLEAREV